MLNISKQEYTAELKELAVKRVKDGQGIGPVAANWDWSSTHAVQPGQGCRAWPTDPAWGQGYHTGTGGAVAGECRECVHQDGG